MSGERNLVGHTLNTDPEHWDLIRDGLKFFEIRLDDRDYQVGDQLDLRRASRRQVERMHELGAKHLRDGGLTEEESLQLQALRDCPRLRCWIVSKVRLSGAVVPAEPHWWRVVDAMQHGIVVMGIEVEKPSRCAAGSKHHREARDRCTCPGPGTTAVDCPVHGNGI